MLLLLLVLSMPSGAPLLLSVASIDTTSLLLLLLLLLPGLPRCLLIVRILRVPVHVIWVCARCRPVVWNLASTGVLVVCHLLVLLLLLLLVELGRLLLIQSLARCYVLVVGSLGSRDRILSFSIFRF